MSAASDSVTQRVAQTVKELFPDIVEEVVSLLERECGRNLPMQEKRSPEQWERIQLAVLKLSEGNLDSLWHHIEMAKVDWRDVLLAARGY